MQRAVALWYSIVYVLVHVTGICLGGMGNFGPHVVTVFFCNYIVYLQVNLNLQSSTLMYIHLAQFAYLFWMKKKTGDLPSL